MLDMMHRAGRPHYSSPGCMRLHKAPRKCVPPGQLQGTEITHQVGSAAERVEQRCSKVLSAAGTTQSAGGWSTSWFRISPADSRCFTGALKQQKSPAVPRKLTFSHLHPGVGNTNLYSLPAYECSQKLP